MGKRSVSFRSTSNIDVKRVNRNRIYRLIATAGGISKPEIAKRLGMSLPTVIQNINALEDKGFIRENGILESTGGRKAVSYSIAPEARTAIGVEITKDHVDVALVDLAGTIVDSINSNLAFSVEPHYAKDLADLVHKLLDRTGADRERVLGVGISIPGIVSADGSMLTSDVLGLVDFQTATITRCLDFPCLFINDANAAGIAELALSEPGRNFIYLALSTSVGAAILRDNRLERGDCQQAGEVGHMTLQRGGPRCYCGKKGCFDVYCSTAVLAERAGGSLETFFDMLEAGDAKIRTVWENYLDYLATGLNIMHVILDCDIVLGGYLGPYLDKHLDDLRARAGELDTFNSRGKYIRACRCRTEPNAVGAALLHIKNFVAEI